MSNIYKKVIDEFGDESLKFNCLILNTKKLNENFNEYFGIFPWDVLPKDAVGFDMGCDSGRLAQFAAPKVKTLNCVEPSEAINAAKKI